MFDRHCREIEIVEQPRINGNLWPGEIGPVFAPRAAHFVVGAASADGAVMMLVGGLVPSIDDCTIVFDEDDLLG